MTVPIALPLRIAGLDRGSGLSGGFIGRRRETSSPNARGSPMAVGICGVRGAGFGPPTIVEKLAIRGAASLRKRFEGERGRRREVEVERVR